jgi:hypothetical protein
MKGKASKHQTSLPLSRSPVAARLALVPTTITVVLVAATGLTGLASARFPRGPQPANAVPLARADQAKKGKHSPPKAWTGEAFGIRATEAVLTGYINPGNLRTEYRFQYGLSKRYGTLAPKIVEEVLVGSRKLEVEAAVDCLKPKTTYHFRIFATSQLGKVYGKDATFKTKRGTGSAPSGFCDQG